MSDYYRILGVEPQATAEELKRSYRRLARRYHPDVNPGDPRAEAHFKRLTEAYDVLADRVRREEYDRFGDLGSRNQHGAEAGAQRQGGPDSGVRDLFSELFRGSKSTRDEDGRGADIHTAVDLSFVDAARGLTTRILVQREVGCGSCDARAKLPGSRRERCGRCGGTGRVRGLGLFRVEPKGCPDCGGIGTRESRACGDCAGRGLRSQEETLTVKIPAGVDNGARVRLAGKGHSRVSGGTPGDVFVITRVAPHPHFERQGDNLFLRVPISIPEAVLGAKVPVPTLDGTATIKVPQGTTSGQRFRLAGKGIASLRSGQRGDQFVEVQVVVPRLRDERSREIMKEFARLNDDDPRLGLFR